MFTAIVQRDCWDIGFSIKVSVLLLLCLRLTFSDHLNHNHSIYMPINFFIVYRYCTNIVVNIWYYEYTSYNAVFAICVCKLLFILEELMTIYFSDVNECDESTDSCQQNCHNTNGSYECSCNAGYTLNPDGFSCDGMLTLFTLLHVVCVVMILKGNHSLLICIRY